MASSSRLDQANIPIFAGQGNPTIDSAQTYQQALRALELPLGGLLLNSCHRAFLEELSSLNEVEAVQVRLPVTDFPNPAALLAVPSLRHRHNSLLSGTRLFLIQALFYLSYENSLEANPSYSFGESLRTSAGNQAGILGFSSGILPACVVATSASTVEYIYRSVQAFRLAFWIGVRAQIYRSATLTSPAQQAFPWSISLSGINKDDVSAALESFSQTEDRSPLFITAIISDDYVTVSGHPETLAAFSGCISNRCNVHKTSIDTLYHCPLHESGAREDVIADIARRNIEFPTLKDIKVPLRSTYTGELLYDEGSPTQSSLVELVVDMIFIQPVRWDLIVAALSKSSLSKHSVRLLTIGSGTALGNVTKRAFGVDSRIFDVGKGIADAPTQEPIAIIGMGLNMPGAPNASELWSILERGINTVSQIPDTRFNVSDYNDAKNKTSRSMTASTGNFIADLEDFDHRFFSISPREAKSMDPQQRLLLHCAHRALENAGYVPHSTPSFNPETFGCYIGAATNDYVQNLRDEIDVYYSTGTLKAFLSGRISHAMRLSGPSVVVDTACSSSLVALYQGCRALTNRDCNAALVGGVNAITSPDMYIGLDKGHFLSPTGQCKSFDASADGYSRGEGCGLFVIKRLSDAVADNDRILGVIRGVDINQSGTASSITRPHAPTQEELFRRVLRSSGITANRVNVVESHGTGTQAGDPSEMESLRNIFAVRRPAPNPLHITSVKANIGHLEAASGAAGLAKLLLMLQHNVIPQQISLKTLNPNIAPLESDNTVISTQNTPWKPSHDGMTRVALLNNFGAAGSNSALVLEEHAPRDERVNEPPAIPYVFGISAKSQTALSAMISQYDSWLRSPKSSNARVSDIAYTATARRQLYPYRIAFSVRDKPDLIQKLNAASIIPPRSHQPTGTIFVFSGQGGQYHGMGKSLYESSNIFKSHIDDAHKFLIEAGFPGILHIIKGEESVSMGEEEFESYQAAILALEYGVAKLWISWGVHPTAVVGHSLGEYAALVISDVLTIQDALFIVASRARLMTQRCAAQTTCMLAVNLGSERLEAVLRGSEDFSKLSIACYNSRDDCVVSGPVGSLRELKTALNGEARSKILTVPFGYHSTAMEPILDALTDITTTIPLRAPKVPVVSNVLGEVVAVGDASVFQAAYFARHCAQPVLFDKGARALVASSCYTLGDAWIEIGPHPTTIPMLSANDAVPASSLLLASLRKQQTPWQTLTESLSKLYSSDISVAWRQVFAHVSSCQSIELPAYPFSTSKFLVPFKESAISASSPSESSNGKGIELSMLTSWLQYPSEENGKLAIFESPVDDLATYILGHSVGGSALCPASVYIELALAGVQLANSYQGVVAGTNHTVLRDVKFVNPLVYDKNNNRVIRTSITQNDGGGSIVVSSRISLDDHDSVHMTGEYALQETARSAVKFSRIAPLLDRWISAVTEPGGVAVPEYFSKRTAYSVIFPRIVSYSKEYHTMQSITIDSNGMEGHALVQFPDEHHRGNFIIHPAFTDTLLHVAGFVANLQGDANDAFICTSVGSSRILPSLVNNKSQYAVFCRMVWLPEEKIMLAESFAVQRSKPHLIVARMKDIQFRRVRLDSLQRSLSHASKSVSPPTKLRPSNTKPLTQQALNLAVDSNHLSNRRKSDEGVQSMVLEVFSKACDIPLTSLESDTPLEAIGVDSLMIIDLLDRLHSTFPHIPHLSARELSDCHTIADVSMEMMSKTSSGAETPSSPSTLATEESSVHSCSASAEVTEARDVLASVLGVNRGEIVSVGNFQDLGLDSLSSIETLHALNEKYGISLPHDLFNTCVDLTSLEAYISAQLSHTTRLPTDDVRLTSSQKHRSLKELFQLDALPRLIKKSTNAKACPLVVIHDGGGLVDYYDRLPSIDRDIWGIHNPHFLTEQQWGSLPEMAAAYLSYVTSITKGPVLLGGWSFGGVVAFEVARQLLLSGAEVKGVVLIDSPSPLNHVPLPTSLLDAIAGLDARIQSGSEIHRLIKTQFELNTTILGRYEPPVGKHIYPKLALLRSKEGFNPSNVPHNVIIPPWLAQRHDSRQVAEGWEKLVGQSLRVWDIPGHHFQPFDPSNVSLLSSCIDAACQHLEQ